MVSSGQAFNSLSYCAKGMELSKAETCHSCLSACLGSPLWCISWERRGCTLGWEGLLQWMEVWSVSSSRGLVLQQQHAAQVAAKKGKNVVSAKLWSQVGTLWHQSQCMLLTGPCGPGTWQLASCHAGQLPSLWVQEKHRQMQTVPWAGLEQTLLYNLCFAASSAPIYLEHINKIKQTISSMSYYQLWMCVLCIRQPCSLHFMKWAARTTAGVAAIITPLTAGQYSGFYEVP